MILADGLGGVDLAPLGRVEVPEDGLVGGDQLDGELVGDEDVAVGEQGGVADLPLALGVVVGPDDLTFADDKDFALLGLAGVEEIVLGQAVAGEGGGDRGGFVRGVGERGEGKYDA